MTDFALTHSPEAESSFQELVDRLPVAYFEIDEQGLIKLANRVALSVFQINPPQLIGKPAWDFVPSDERLPDRNAYFAALQSGADPAPVRRTVYGKHGQFRVCDMFRSLILDPEGHPAGMRYVAIDVTDRLAAHEEMQRESHWFESILHSLADPLIVTDALGLVRYLNPPALSLTGWAPGEAIGRVIEEVLPILSYTPADGTSFSYRSQLERQSRGTATILDRKRYQLRVEVVTSPLVNQQAGVIEGTVLLLRKTSPLRP